MKWHSLSPFIRARLTLTGWYFGSLAVLLTLFTLLTFSAKESSYIRVHSALNEQTAGNTLSQFEESFEIFNARFQDRVILFDLVILGIALPISWWLSGKTLAPIQKTIQHQSDFVGNVSHELRTPMTIARFELEDLLEEPSLQSDITERVFGVYQELIRMSHLIEGLLLLTRSEQVRLPLERIDMAALVNEAIAVLHPIAEAKSIKLLAKANPVAPVMGHRDLLLQLLLIFLDNAIKYSPAGKSVWVESRDDHSGVLLFVRDSGPGISDEEKQLIFSRQYRAPKTADIEGSGIGLSIARLILDVHDATVSVHNLTPGTEFRVRIPAAA